MSPPYPVSGCQVFAAVAANLVALGEGGQGVRHRHLAGLVALQTEFFEDLASAETAPFPDHAQQLLTAASTPTAGRSAPGASSPGPGTVCVLALEHVEFREHPIELVELLLNRALLVQQLLPLVQQSLALARYESFGFGQDCRFHRTSSILDVRVCRCGLFICKPSFVAAADQRSGSNGPPVGILGFSSSWERVRID